ncbi:MAG TPA: CHAT domain-containing protein, partial [Candidatus Acetothermia bacterium]|nr:CHAT domain-containing protein [Candidatus Acetothermia bacterium]HDS29285.1 CHAT domain-containing protein [Candidatus Acetothermia bacterium]
GMYGHLLGGETRAEALRRAQLALGGDPALRYRHPYYWAPFVLYGDWR